MDLLKSSSEASSGNAVKSPGRIGYLKKTIARILTIKNIKGGK